MFVDNVELTGKTPEGKPLSVKTFAGKHKLRVKRPTFSRKSRMSRFRMPVRRC